MKLLRWGLIASCFLVSACSDEIGSGVQIVQKRSLIESNERICIVGDPGSGSDEQYAVARALKGAGCTQVRVLGDIIYPSGLSSIDDPLLQSNFYKPYAKLLKSAPFYLIQGNHDYMQGFMGLWNDIAYRDSQIIYPSAYYSERWGDICFISLDSSFYEKLYYFAKRAPQTNWLRQVLDKARDQCRFSVVFAHHPYRSPGHHGTAQPLLHTFLKSEIMGKVDMYIAGHDHILADEGYAEGTRLLISGSAGEKSGSRNYSADTRFIANKFGFIVLSFKRGEKNKIEGDFEFYTVETKSNSEIVTLEWESAIVGEGIRL